METEHAYCPVCDARVRIAWTPAATHDGQAPLPDGDELVCLEIAADGCGPGTVCPLSSMPRSVMALRLAKSGLRDAPAPTVRTRCDGCGEVVEMETVEKQTFTARAAETGETVALDRSTLLCPLCGTVARLLAPSAGAAPHSNRVDASG
jgi:hypothetical protein